MSKPMTAVVAGAGKRGQVYASYALMHPSRLQITAVAEPHDQAREGFAEQHQIASDKTFLDWRDLALQPRLADAAIITTQDQMHTEPAIALAQKGYHLLLEKPMAPTLAECGQIVEAVKAAGVMLCVGHVLRYTDYTQALKAEIMSGSIGEVVNVHRLEPLGHWHHAHSFVRGNWRNEAQSSFMLLAKSCHDIDWLRHIMAEPCVSVSSFGNLSHFHKDKKPEAAKDATRCVACDFEPECPYSAKKIYLERAQRGEVGMPVSVITFDTTPAGVEKAITEGPYGRCVYECDNDVVDHQVVSMLFQSGKTANFTMCGPSRGRHRETTIFGSRGEIVGNGSSFTVYDFATDTTRTVQTASSDDVLESDTDASSPIPTAKGHGGGDYGLIHAFVQAVRDQDPTQLLSGPDETLESHRIVFAAERARREHCVIDL